MVMLDALHSLWLSFTGLQQQKKQQLHNAVRDCRPAEVAASQDCLSKKHHHPFSDVSQY